MIGTAARHYLTVGESLPIPEHVDWSAAPPAHKLYRGLPRTRLGYDDPLGRLCADAYRISRLRWTSPGALRRVIGTRGAAVPDGRAAVSTLRPVPSGGARFPGELYVVTGPSAGVPPGVHYYDAAHHGLVTLRPGDHRPSVAAAVGGSPCRWPAVTFLLSLRFGKNAFKYGELCYRLGALDVGVLLGQILEAARGEAVVRFQFVDDELDTLLGLDPDRESVLAAMTVGAEKPITAPADSGSDGVAGSSGYRCDWALSELPAPSAVHRASRYRSTRAFRRLRPDAADRNARGGAGATVALPDAAVDLPRAVPVRRSSMGYFVPRTLPAAGLAGLLRAATKGYPSDVDDRRGALRGTVLYCVVNNVDGVPAGIHRYDPDRHALVEIRPGDVGVELQRTLTVNLFNLSHTGVCLYPVGCYDVGLDAFGDRWYRMQNMEAGIVTQRVYLAAAAMGLRCHANLGYDVARTNRLLGLAPDRTALIHLMVGAGREPGDYYELPC